MGDTLNIQNLLQTGYFTTSRARGAPSPSLQPDSPPSPEINDVERTIPRAYEEPRSYSRSPKPSQPRPPPPTVEDEEVSLAKEHGNHVHTAVKEDEPQNRGEFQQESVLEDVHEFNPERRFVYVPKSDSSGEDDSDSKKDRKREIRRRRDTITDPSAGRRREPLKTGNSTDEDASTADHAKRDRRETRDRQRDRDRESGTDRKSDRRHESVFDERPALNVPEAPPLSRRSSERRKSRHDLPRLDTGLMPENPKQRPRTKSAVGGPRPDFFGSKPSRPRDDRDGGLLSPDVVKHGSGRRGDRQYHGHGYSAGSDARPSYPRSFSNSADDRDRKDERDEGSRDYYNKDRDSPTSSRRSSAYHKANRDDRRAPSERSSDSRRREEPSSSSRSHRRENSKSSYQDDDNRRGLSTGRSRDSRPQREDSRSSDDHTRGPKTSDRRRRKSVIIQDERRSAPNFGTSSSGLQSPRDREFGSSPNMPSSGEAPPAHSGHSDHSSSGAAIAAGGAAAALGAAAVASSSSATPRASESFLPYPEDDTLTPQLPQIRAPDDWYVMSPSDTEPVQERDGGVRLVPSSNSDPEFNSIVVAPSPTATTTPANNTWEPGSFVPDRDGLPVDKRVGSYRRYSENQDSSGPPRLPECRFTKPVAGSNAWLTLPRSDFNICTECYTAVFADTNYRTQFQPMLYSAERPIACDFGSSPWYRIAWLLTLRSGIPDLRLFYSISQIATLCQAQPCPNDRKTVMTWLTILDPTYRTPVPYFTVCYQCAKTVEALLPDINGIFVPWDPRSEPTKGVCALHYQPQRKEFVLFFDVLETAADDAHATKQPIDMDGLCRDIERLSVRPESCPKDNPLRDGYWHSMQFMHGFTVCGHCFDEVVKPRLDEKNVVARNFYQRPLVYKEATCQLYSDRMRDVFRRACRKEDFTYLETRAKERMRKEDEIHRELERLDRRGHDSTWVADQVKLLVDEWKEWE